MCACVVCKCGAQDWDRRGTLSLPFFLSSWHKLIREEGALCVEMGFTWTLPRNQDAKVKLKSELISIKF